MSDARWMDADSAARYLCIRPDAFLRRVRSGIIPSGKKGLGERTTLWWSADLDAVVRGNSDVESVDHRAVAQAIAEEIIAQGRRPRRSANAS